MKFFLQLMQIIQIVQIGVKAMHGGSPMHVTEDQKAGLQACADQFNVRELQPRPMEYAQFATHEPYFTVQKLISQLLGLTSSEAQEGEELVEQVSLPKEIITIARSRVGESGAPFMQGLQEAVYDPSAAHTTTTSFWQFARTTKVIKQDRTKFKEELKKIGKIIMFFLGMKVVLLDLVVPALGAVLVEQFQYVTAFGVPSSIEVLHIAIISIVAVLLVKLIWIFIEINVVLKFAGQEIQRVRMSVTTGDPGAWWW